MTIAENDLPDGVHTATSFGYLHSVETGAAVDGPGMRFVFFMAGCQFRCLYCHNPDTWKLHNGRKVTVEDMVSEVGSYSRFLKMTGGVTFSGGEPMLQANFVGDVAREIKARYDLHICLDTQGYLHTTVSDDWFDPIDMLLLDIKHIDPEKHKALTAQPLQPTLDCAQRMVRLGKKMRIRYVYVPGWSDDPDDVAKMADYVAGLGDVVELVELLPFHQLGISKWDNLKLDYKLRDTPTPTPEEAEAARDIFRARGLKVT